MSRDRTARTRIRQFLATSGPIVDPSGYATSVLKDAVGYVGSSVAFIQLIAAMDREGEIQREIVGKRTYKIEGIGVPVTPSHGIAAPLAQAQTQVQVANGQPVLELDYKRLAQALIAELLAATAEARSVPGVVTPATEALAAERDEYARRLEAARNQLDVLLGQPIGSVLLDDAVVGHTTD